MNHDELLFKNLFPELHNILMNELQELFPGLQSGLLNELGEQVFTFLDEYDSNGNEIPEKLIDFFIHNPFYVGCISPKIQAVILDLSEDFLKYLHGFDIYEGIGYEIIRKQGWNNCRY